MDERDRDRSFAYSGCDPFDVAAAEASVLSVPCPCMRGLMNS